MTETSTKPRIILAAADDSPAAAVVTQTATRLGASLGAELHFIRVVEPLPPPPPMVGHPPLGLRDSPAEIIEAARKDLDLQLQTARETFGGPLFGHVAMGHACPEILACARELEADVIVVGTHGRKGLRRMVVGSVAEGVVRRAACPVVVARPKAYDAEPARAGGGSRFDYSFGRAPGV